MAKQRFLASHVFVTLHPVTGDNLPTPFPDAFGDPFQHFGIMLFDNLINAGLALGKMKLRKFIHQFQHGGKGVIDDGNGFRPGPHPIHVYVRMPCAIDRISFGR